jgi:hypothetical protein
LRLFLSTFVTAATLAFSAGAATVVEFTSVNGIQVAADLEGTGVTGFSLGRSTGLNQNAGGTFNSNDWFIGGDKLQALVAKDSLFWGFNSTIGYDLTTLSFGYDRSPTGPKSIAVDFFINNVSQGQIFADLNVAENSSATATIDLSAFDNVTNGFFRLTGWNATSSQGTFDIENRAALGGKGIVINGDISPVPLPAGLPLLLGGLAVLVGLRRRT